MLKNELQRGAPFLFSSLTKVFWKGEVRSRTGDPRFRARRITTAPDGRFVISLTKVFWKGEFEGKNLFFKKGFPLLIKLEKTSLKGRQLAGDRKFFQGGRNARQNF